MGGSTGSSPIGDKWQKGPINSPTVLNSSLNLAQFWTGVPGTCAEQAGGPIANPGEMAFTHDLAVACCAPFRNMWPNSRACFGINS
jgi:cytochrome c peroxidase